MMSEILRDHGLGKGLNGADKKALIDAVNAADTNQSTVKTNIINALLAKDANLPLSNASTFADIIAAIPSIYIGKKWAMGTFSLPGTSSSYTVTGLGFVPSMILLHYATTSDDPTATIDVALQAKTYGGSTTTWKQSVAGMSTKTLPAAKPTGNSFVVTQAFSSSYTMYARWYAFE
ncbi:hypothetical protein [Brevibacillus fulvus]|uniref:Tail fiber protein n=1 Tax=Brevibacillus fulvus TaxID=1125967 RepID=A0A939BSV1_9BACL|nr:hypothetical protein [Brevibacillus fulvus]MBM7590868.1 hypothetical protein [Brevibacillus fulvus]